MAQNKLYKTVDGVKAEMTPEEKETFTTDIEAQALLETEYKAKQKAREDAIKKLAEVAGLTEEEINAIL